METYRTIYTVPKYRGVFCEMNRLDGRECTSIYNSTFCYIRKHVLAVIFCIRTFCSREIRLYHGRRWLVHVLKDNLQVVRFGDGTSKVNNKVKEGEFIFIGSFLMVCRLLLNCVFCFGFSFSFCYVKPILFFVISLDSFFFIFS